MARSCGLRIGSRRFELVVLDGNAKKHKIAAYMTGDLVKDPDDPIGSAAATLREALKQHNIPRDNVGLAIDTGLAAFRTLKVPFADREKIEEVLKFEVEGMLPQWNIDDVVADFHPLESSSEASELLVTAVPKADLKQVLAICERAGVEPLEAELETSAMVNAALQSNICSVDNAQVLVHIGETSTCVVVMDSAKVREMRAIHIGALSHELAPAALIEGEPNEGDVPPVDPNDPAELQRRVEQAIKRIRRELGRTVSAARTVHPIESIYVCGLELPQLIGSKILDAEVRMLDVFEKDGGQPAEGFGELVVPYGVALRQLGGGVLRPSLRREELRYAGAFEKIELPLAVVALLAVTFLGVWFIFLWKETRFVDDKFVFWRDSAKNYLVGEPKKGHSGLLAFPPKAVMDYTADLDADTERNKFEQMVRMRTLVRQDIDKLKKELGQDATITQPQSALQGMTLVLGVLESQVKNGARPSLRKVVSTYTLARQGKSDTVRITMNCTFFAENSLVATQQYETFISDLQSRPWCVNVERKGNNSIDGGQGIFVEGMVIDVDVSKADTKGLE